MHTHARTTALTLYRSGTLSLTQAAQRAGCSETEMVRSLRKHGISVREKLHSSAVVQQPPAHAH